MARATFRDFWKEVATDFNRIVPALELACVKAVFFDGDSDLEVQHEHMWMEEIDFDGETIAGVLINSPNWIKTVSEGDNVSISMNQLSDWMCVINGSVYGAYTVQVLRSRMGASERAEHDDAWGFTFPEPNIVLTPEHPEVIEAHLASGLADYLRDNPQEVNQTDEYGRTLLHREVLYGRLQGARVLVENGADIHAKCNRGWTALNYATATGWNEIARFLREHGARE
jgi:uncharacterized protein YegJ (DUF2314 family)